VTLTGRFRLALTAIAGDEKLFAVAALYRLPVQQKGSPIMGQFEPTHVHLVGSIGLDTVDEVFSVVGPRRSNATLGKNMLKPIAIVAGTVCLFVSFAASAAEIKVLASGATKEVIDELLPAFEKSTGNKVNIAFTGTASIKKRIAAGEAYDLIIVGGPVIDAFVQQGKITAGSRADLMKSGVGVAVRAGAPKPDIGSSEGLKKTLLSAKSIGYSSGPSGDYVVSLVERMGIADQIKPKMKQVPSGTRISEMITGGEAELGFQQISELIHEKGIDYLGPLPSEVQKITVFSAGLQTGAKEPDAAKALVKALKSPEAATVIKAHGMEPG
jgi:molybdate transport system substrate-binding protein